MIEKLNSIKKDCTPEVKEGMWVNLSRDKSGVVCKPATSSILFLGLVTGFSEGKAVIDPLEGIAYKTDIYDTSKPYDVNAKLFVADGKLTTENNYESPVGVVLDPPSAVNPYLEYLCF